MASPTKSGNKGSYIKEGVTVTTDPTITDKVNKKDNQISLNQSFIISLYGGLVK